MERTCTQQLSCVPSLNRIIVYISLRAFKRRVLRFSANVYITCAKPSAIIAVPKKYLRPLLWPRRLITSVQIRTLKERKRCNLRFFLNCIRHITIHYVSESVKRRFWRRITRPYVIVRLFFDIHKEIFQELQMYRFVWLFFLPDNYRSRSRSYVLKAGGIKLS